MPYLIPRILNWQASDSLISLILLLSVSVNGGLFTLDLTVLSTMKSLPSSSLLTVQVLYFLYVVLSSYQRETLSPRYPWKCGDRWERGYQPSALSNAASASAVDVVVSTASPLAIARASSSLNVFLPLNSTQSVRITSPLLLTSRRIWKIGSFDLGTAFLTRMILPLTVCPLSVFLVFVVVIVLTP